RCQTQKGNRDKLAWKGQWLLSCYVVNFSGQQEEEMSTYIMGCEAQKGRRDKLERTMLSCNMVKLFGQQEELMSAYKMGCGVEEEDNDGFYEQLQLQSPTSHSVT
ncbi:unnamed protein product, partial [Porites lobata]